MAKRKKKKWFSFGSGKKKTKAQLQRSRDAVWFSIKIILLGLFVGAVCVGLYLFDDKYVKVQTGIGSKWVKINLVDEPKWMSNDLRRKIYETAGDGNGWFLLDSDTAATVYSRLSTFPWLYNLKVKTDPNAITVFADYYKPALLVESKNRKTYIAPDQPEDADEFNIIVLNYAPIYELSIPTLIGAETRYMPEPGLFWQQEDVRAAVELINLLKLMDQNMTDNAKTKELAFKPLLEEIGSIDVSNFNGRKNKKQPHIILYAKDQTPIHWGAIQGNLEAVPAEKLGKLYQCYKDFGTLQLKSRGLLKYIDLTMAEKINPLP